MFDILKLETKQENTFLESLLYTPNPMVQMETLKLLESIAKDYEGRTYLESEFVIKILRQKLREN